MQTLEMIGAVLGGAALFFLWLRLFWWLKLKDIDRRNRRDALTELHLQPPTSSDNPSLRQ